MISCFARVRISRLKDSREAIVNQSESSMMGLFHEIQIGSVLEGRVQRKDNRLWSLHTAKSYTNEIIWAKPMTTRI
jgi:hypothetical protein